MAELEIQAAGLAAQNKTVRHVFALSQLINPLVIVPAFVIVFGILFGKYPTFLGFPINLPFDAADDSLGRKIGHSILYSLLISVIIVYSGAYLFAILFSKGAKYL